MPAEWEPQTATWLGWPVNEDDWPGKLAAAQWAFADFVRQLSEVTQVELIAPDKTVCETAAKMLRDAGAVISKVRLHPLATNRNWLRDSGPLFVRRADGGLEAMRFGFNAWAKYNNCELDVKIPEYVARVAGVEMPEVVIDDRLFVLEGGAIDVNGAGWAMVTEECLLDEQIQPRNPGFGREDYEAVFEAALGVERTVWLGKGIVGDDTHGHIDDVARFVGERRVVLCAERKEADPNNAALHDNRQRLELAGLEVVALPMPRPLRFQGIRLPASYANFYVANERVFVPTFNDPADRAALGVLADCFPDREVVGIHCLDLVWGLGTLHCLTQQQPSRG
jgi:agmatine deiminase